MVPAAVLWDFDGTLVDTEPYWIETEQELVAEHGGTWTHEQGLQLVGNDLLVSGAIMVEQAGLPMTPAQVVDRLLDGVVAHMRRSIPWRPGARALLDDLAAAGVACGLVTMSYQRFVAPVLEALPEGTFSCVVTGEQVTRGKPAPDAYLRAASLLGVPPGECIALEDSPPGAASAAAAGCRVAVVPSHVPMPPGPDRVVLDALPTTLSGLLDAVGVAPAR